MGITRRQFTGAAWRMALTGAAAPLVASCGGGNGSDDDAPPPLGEAPAGTEIKTFHFDLTGPAVADSHTLHCGGRRYALKPHDAASRLAARQAKPGLARVPDEHLTHYADGVEVRTDRQQRIHVTTISPTRGHGLMLVSMHIPTASRIAARRARGLGAESCSGACPGDDDICSFDDQVEDDFVSGRSTAKAIITHYPDVMNLDPDVAAKVETLMDGSQSAAVDNLAFALCDQGPAYEHDDQYQDGWCVLVQQFEPGGAPMFDSHDPPQPIFDYVYSDATNAALLPAVQTIVKAIKNDASLNGEQYQILYHGDDVDTGSLPEANPTPLVGAPASAPAPQAGSGSEVAFSTLGYHHNVLFYGETGSAASRQFSLKILNLNYIWYGLYLEYFNAGGQHVLVEGSGVLHEALNDYIGIETDTLGFWDMISSPPAIFGIPLPFPYRVTIDNLPPGVASVKLSLIGPGSYGSVPYGPAVLPGIVMTAVVQYMLPMFFLGSGKGIDSTKSLIELILDQPNIWVKTLSEVSQIVTGATGSNSNDYGLEGSVVSLLAGVVQNALVIPLKTMTPDLWGWIVKTLSREEAEDNVPFVGWILRAVAVAGTVGAMLATTAEIDANPIAITNTVSFKHSITFVVSADERDFGFPLTATRCTVQITIGWTTLEPATEVRLAPGQPSPLSITVDGVPATGSAASVSVTVWSASGYPVAHSAAVGLDGQPATDGNGNPVAGDVAFTNTAPASGVLTIAVPTVENAAPVTASTRYVHDRKLTYAAGRYDWTRTATPPALQPAACGSAAGLCRPGSVTVWLPGGMIGASWLASSPTVRACTGGASGQLYDFRNVGLKNDPNVGYLAPGCGFPATVPLAYDMSARVGANGLHFYLEAVSVSQNEPESHLRRIALGSSGPAAPQTQSWGRFRAPIDRIAIYGKGSSPRVVGISTSTHKLAVLTLPDAPYTDNLFANNAKLMCGEGDSDALLRSPVALTIADNGAILVLQGSTTKSVKAFDVDGKPWQIFSGDTTSVLPLAQDAPNVTWLDISIDATNLLYVLSYTGAGTQASDYRLDIYDTGTGQRVVRNTGIAVAGIVVDRFRALYSVNHETVQGAPGVEPSVSVWAPSS